MNSYIGLKKSNCKDCYKCIRNCPVKSIRFSDHQACIIDDECILCGMCFISCPQNAKIIREDYYNVIDEIKKGKDVYASIAPSFISSFPDYTIVDIENALIKLGFKGAEETAIGATVVKQAYDDMVNLGNNKVVISSCCHSVNLLIQKHYKEALPYLAPVVSPMVAHGKKLKKDHKDCITVFIGPCISKKSEADLYSEIDYALTFEELSNWMKNENVILEHSLIDRDKGRARIFPTTGGILKTMLCENKDYTYMAIDGINNCINALEDIISGNITNCFIEMSACYGSCINGPCQTSKANHIQDYINIHKMASQQDFSVDDNIDLNTEMKPFNVHKVMPTENDIQKVLSKMNKHSVDMELNCGSCGYNTCREKAIAVYQGKALISMCLPYLKEKAESFSDNIITNTPNGIIVLNESYEIQLINQAACNIVNVRNCKDVIGSPVVQILEPDNYMEVLKTKKNIMNHRVYLTEYNRTIEESIIYDEKYHIMIGFLRDISSLESQKQHKDEICQRTIDITDEVIKKQMRVVQEIASLLGETTAETKVALTKLKESLEDE